MYLAIQSFFLLVQHIDLYTDKVHSAHTDYGSHLKFEQFLACTHGEAALDAVEKYYSLEREREGGGILLDIV